jgi:hypothetical protein
MSIDDPLMIGWRGFPGQGPGLRYMMVKSKYSL